MSLPLWKIWLRQLGWGHSQLNGKIIQSCSKAPTSQLRCDDPGRMDQSSASKSGPLKSKAFNHWLPGRDESNHPHQRPKLQSRRSEYTMNIRWKYTWIQHFSELIESSKFCCRTFTSWVTWLTTWFMIHQCDSDS